MPAHLRLVKDEVNLDTLKKFNLIYLASPYTLYAKGLTAAFEEVTELAGKLVKHGLPIFCPITYGHPMTVYGSVPAMDERVWYPLNDAFLRKSDCLLVARMTGHQSSKGVQREISHFEKVGSPVYFVHPETLDVY
jgi:hypothetical protein